MRFHRKPSVGRLQPIVTAYSGDFSSHQLLVVPVEKMFDHRIAENNINAAVLEVGQVCCITHY